MVVSLIVGLATCLGGSTASYDAAKAQDSRFANGSDIRITPSPTSGQAYGVAGAGTFRTDGVAEATPVIYGVSNVILRSARTSDPANLAAVDPDSYASVAPVSDVHFPSGDAAGTLHELQTDPTAVLLSEEMAAFLKAQVGDSVFVLLARATDQQVDVEFHVVALFERLPGFPDGADAVISIDAYAAGVPSKDPDFFLASAATNDDAGLERAVTSLQRRSRSTGRASQLPERHR